MNEVDFEEIESLISSFGWYGFGNKKFNCPGLTEENIMFYLENKKLPPLCDSCYKALIFWSDYYSEEGVNNLFRMLEEESLIVRGKFNHSVVVFYFDKKEEVLSFVEFLKKKLSQYGINGGVQWRRACKGYQVLKPNWWKSAKEFNPP